MAHRGARAAGFGKPVAAPENAVLPRGGSLGIDRWSVLVELRGEPVLGPLGGVAMHVVETPGIRLEMTDGGGEGMAVIPVHDPVGRVPFLLERRIADILRSF